MNGKQHLQPRNACNPVEEKMIVSLPMCDLGLKYDSQACLVKENGHALPFVKSLGDVFSIVNIFKRRKWKGY